MGGFARFVFVSRIEFLDWGVGCRDGVFEDQSAGVLCVFSGFHSGTGLFVYSSGGMMRLLIKGLTFDEHWPHVALFVLIHINVCIRICIYYVYT